MTGPQLAIVALVYIAALVLGMRVTALALPQAQEIGFVVAALAGALTAGLLLPREIRGERHRAPAKRKIIIGAFLAGLAAVFGLTVQMFWQPMFRPAISLPIAMAGTFAAPFIVLPLLRNLRPELSYAAAPRPVGELHVIIAAAVTLLILVIAAFIPVPGRSNVRLAARQFPSLFIGLPPWKADQEFATMEFGSIKLQDPARPGERFLALRWMDSDPVQADDYVQTIAVGDLSVQDRAPAFVNQHQGATFYLESDDGLARAVTTIWNCPQDHRVLWLFSYLAGSKSSMLATHQKILKNAHCHNGRGRDTAATQPRVYPAFAAPPGFSRQAEAAVPAYVGPEGKEIAFDAALPGRSDILDQHVSPQLIAKLFSNMGILQRVEGTPILTRVNDLQGHTRHVWSVSGIGPTRRAVHMDVMIWYCDVHNLTFIGRYATPTPHAPQDGIDAMLPSACHRAAAE